MNYKQFKEDMFDKLIIHDGYSINIPSFDIDTSTGDPNTEMHPEQIQLRETISLICDIIEEYDKQRNH